MSSNEKITAATKELDDAITQYDVGASIQDEDIPLWNAVVAAARKLVVAIEGDA